MGVCETEPGGWKNWAPRWPPLLRAGANGARLYADEWQDQDPREGDDRADERSLMNELVGDRVQPDQEDEHNEH